MITCEQMYEATQKYGFYLFSGVPDSTFKDWLRFLEDGEGDFLHIATVNECDAIAIVSGYHLATGKVGVAYMQNSGLCNSINPLTSLADPEVYSIPMVLLIGWRGMPGVKDEPQHKKMGRITLPLLTTLEIPYQILSDQPEEMEDCWAQASQYTKQKHAPYAIILRSNIFEPYKSKKTKENKWQLGREEAIWKIIELVDRSSAIVATTGHVSRELYEYRDFLHQGHEQDFYTVGSMGCATSIAMGIAVSNPSRPVIVFDADGAALMHLGSWANVGFYNISNLKHIVFDNECYESTGAQPSNSPVVDFSKIALACGYRYARQVSDLDGLTKGILELFSHPGPGMLVIKVKKGHRPDLGRPKTTPIQNKTAFMEFLQKKESL